MKKVLTRTPGGFKFGNNEVSICGEWQDRIFGTGTRATISDDHFALRSDLYDKRQIVVVPMPNGYTYAVLDGEQAIVDGMLQTLFSVRGELVPGFYTLFTPKGKAKTSAADQTIKDGLDAIDKLSAKIEEQRDKVEEQRDVMNATLNTLDDLADTLQDLREEVR